MPRLHRSPATAPAYFKIRTVKDAADAASITNVAQGVNCGGFTKVHFQVIPSGGANPDVEVLAWSAGAGKFVSQLPTVTKTGPGANTSYEFTVDAIGRVLFVRVTGGIAASGVVDIYASGTP